MERNTRQRTAILGAIEAAGRPLSPAELHALARSEAPALGLATVYRNIKLLLEEGRIREVSLPGEAPRYELDGLVVDVLRRQVSLRGEALHLSPKEYRLLELLARHAGKVLTHRYLLEQLWPEGGEADAQYLRVYVRQLRQKLGDPAEAPHWLLTEAGVGYRLLAPG